MSRNLCQDNCDCGYVFGLKDFIGKPVEFRKYYDYAPKMGTKLICPECGIVYFGYIRDGYDYWGREQSDRKKAFLDEIDYGNGHIHTNREKGKFVKQSTNHLGETYVESLGFYQIDLSYYESYNDEGEGIETEKPAFICTEDDERTRWYQTRDAL